jgi:exosortase C (VPDSG-CTERM-specific)
MEEQIRTAVEQLPEKPTPGFFKRFRGFLPATIIIALCFSIPLYHLARFAADNQLYSYIFLMPFITLYLVRLKKDELPLNDKPASILAAPFFAIGLISIVAYEYASRLGFKMAEDDALALTTFSFLSFFGSVCCLFLGKLTLRALAFPFGLLIFMIPMPVFFRDRVEHILQHGSAAVAGTFFDLSGATFFQEGLIFHLPGINIEVAPECSGIHSSLVLFITSLLAGYLFLHSTWKRAALALFVIPLALVRNGFRVFVIGQLCVHIGPQMINSPIHRRGGPLFFALSLIPFFLLLIILKKSERAKEQSTRQISKI